MNTPPAGPLLVNTEVMDRWLARLGREVPPPPEHVRIRRHFTRTNSRRAVTPRAAA